ncbi:hypothetical protein ACFQZQ_03070 [Lysobacter koreensis]|uniref:Uncharacterized protein n=1 Tax=Lysobacter koreensis TaxID=266122 RepID=A0ABW2YJI8_9GAMM
MSAARIREIVDLANNRLVNVAELAAFFCLDPAEIVNVLRVYG